MSIETTLAHPKRGFVKLEDTIIVTDEGYEAVGDGYRGWNKARQRFDTLGKGGPRGGP